MKGLLLLLILTFSLSTRAQGSGEKISKQQESELSSTYFKALNRHRKQGNYDSAIYYNDRLIEIKSTDRERVKVIFQKLDTYLAFNRTAEAYKLGILTLEKYCGKNSDNCVECTYIFRRLANVMELMGDYEEAITFLEQDCNPNKPGTWYYEKALLQVKLGDVTGALKTAKQHINLSANMREKIGAYNKLGLVARAAERYEFAINAFKTALNLINTEGIRESIKPTILGNLGSCYLAQGEYDEAYRYLLEDTAGSLEVNEIGSHVKAEINLASIEQHWNLHGKAIERLEALLMRFGDVMNNEEKEQLYGYLITSMNTSGNLSGYKKYSKKYIELVEQESEMRLEANRELVKAHSQKSVSLVKDQMAAERELMDKEVQLLEEEQERKSQRNWFIIAGLVLLLVIVVLLFRKYRSDQQKKTQFKQVQLDLAKKEQEILVLKVQEESKNVQELSLELTVKNDFSRSLSKELQKLEGLSSSDRRHIEMFVQSEMDIKSTRAELQGEIGEIGRNFYRDLKIKHSNLSDTEIRLAVMIVLKLSNKEIAIKKNITPDSAKIAKSRLKKKLGLSKEDDMYSYLSQIVHKS